MRRRKSNNVEKKIIIFIMLLLVVGIIFVTLSDKLNFFNIINTKNKDNTDIEIEEIRRGNLTEIIEPKDYGKSIDYKVTVNKQEVSNWKILYNDKNNIYIILDDFLPNDLLPKGTGLDVCNTHNVYSSVSREVLLKGLTNQSYWNEFAVRCRWSKGYGFSNF